MAIDAYSLCPGGTGKKIKFCCGDFLPELQKIDRMIEGEQYLACLQHIDQLLEQEPGRDRACLLATKCMLLRATKQNEAAASTVTTFLSKHPDNQIALAEGAMLMTEQEGQAAQALALVLHAMQAAQGTLSSQAYQAVGQTAGALLRDGLPLPAGALLRLQYALVKDDARPAELLSALCQAGDLPLLLRDDPPLLPCPDNVAWKDRFSEAVQAITAADWRTGGERFAALVADFPEATAAWRNLATVRGWLADNAGAIEALRKYAALSGREEGGLEDAVEAEAKAMFLSNDPLGDRIEFLSVVWTVQDSEQARERLLSSPRIRPIPFDPAQFSDGETPPPKAALMLLDRPMPDSAEGITIETMPHLMAQALLFGRQTDQEARLEVMGVNADDLQSVKDLVAEAAGDSAVQPVEEIVGYISASQKLARAAWQPPRGIAPALLRSMMEQRHREAIFEQWPNLKLGCLDGRSPREAAAVESDRVRVLAAIVVLEHWFSTFSSHVDFNELRAALGLPVQGPIDARSDRVMRLPSIRLQRVVLDNLSDAELTRLFFRVGSYAIGAAVRKFAQAMIDRPSMANSNERIHAYSMLARMEEQPAKALEYIDLGRRAAEAKNQSSATWDLMEIPLRVAVQDGPAAMQLIQHIQEKHGNEPGVPEALMQLLIDLGFLRPDGTPAYPRGGRPSAGAAAEPATADSGGLWTPEGATSGGGSGKLWTPE